MANTNRKKVELNLKVTNEDGTSFYENVQTWPSVGERGVIAIQRALVGAQGAMLDVAEEVANNNLDQPE